MNRALRASPSAWSPAPGRWTFARVGGSGGLGRCCAVAACLTAAQDVVVDRIEDDRVVVEWCDRTTSDLPAALFAANIQEGAVFSLRLEPTPAAVGGVSSQHDASGVASALSATAAGAPLLRRSGPPADPVLPEPRAFGTEPHAAARPEGAALTPRGPTRKENSP